MIREDKSFQTLTLSLALHLGFYLVYKHALPEMGAISSPTTVDIVYKADSQNKTVKQIVHDPMVSQETLDHLKEQAKFLSLLQRRVKDEMVSRNKGHNSAGNSTMDSSPTNTLKFKNKPLELKPQNRLDVSGDFATSHQTSDTQTLGKTLVMGQSMAQDHIPNVKQGGFTALNTDQFTFYTFYSRINEQIYPRWVKNLKIFAQLTPISQLRQAQKSEWVTEVTLVFDREGFFVNYEINKSSGLRRLDWAAIEAFREAAPFLNPPKDMLESDGKFRLNYSFYLIFQPSLFASP